MQPGNASQQTAVINYKIPRKSRTGAEEIKKITRRRDKEKKEISIFYFSSVSLTASLHVKNKCRR